MFFKSKQKENDEMVRYIESNMSPERRIRLMYEEFIKWERKKSMKIYNVKCWINGKANIKMIAATSEANVEKLLDKETVEIEEIIRLDIETAQELHSYELN